MDTTPLEKAIAIPRQAQKLWKQAAALISALKGLDSNTLAALQIAGYKMSDISALQTALAQFEPILMELQANEQVMSILAPASATDDG